MVHLGVDLGGTAIKVGLVDDGGELLSSRSVPTGLPRPPQAICRDIVASATQLLEQENLSWEQVKDLGAGAPGTVNPDRGVVIHAANLGWWDFPLREELSRLCPGICRFTYKTMPMWRRWGDQAGSAKGAASAVVLTIGTGVGSGSSSTTGSNPAITLAAENSATW